MNFLEPQPTSFDLKWRMFGIHVRIHPSFWLVAAILGFMTQGGGRQQGTDLWLLLTFMACMFVSVLFHELGHVFTGRLFGCRANIVLFSFGGLAMGDFHLARRWQRIAIALGGPAAGLLLYGILAVLELQFQIFNKLLAINFLQLPSINRMLAFAFIYLTFMNLVWSLFNLIPVIPLDGGQVTREVVTGINPENGLRMAHGLSFLLAGVIAGYSLLVWYSQRNNPDTELWFPPIDPLFNAIFFGMMAMQNFTTMQSLPRSQRRSWEDEDEDWRNR